MNADISPAPWTWNDGSPLQDADGNLVNSLAKSPAVRASNRRLIAAAPELLADCERAFHVFENDTPRKCEVLGQIAAAIAKSQGQTTHVSCEQCEGTGVLAFNPNLNPDSFPEVTTAKCPHCKGTGQA